MLKSAPTMYRKIVQDSIRATLGNEALWLGMELWDKHFSDAEVPSIKAFSLQLCDHLERPELHGKLYTILLEKFFLRKNQHSMVSEQNLYAVENTPPPASDPLESLLPSAVVFIVLVREIFSQLDFHPESRGHTQIYTQPQLRNLVASLPLTPEQRAFWGEIILKGETINLRSTSERGLKKIFHQIYLALVENFGPVQADQSLNEAIQHVLRLPAARGYSPRNFL